MADAERAYAIAYYGEPNEDLSVQYAEYTPLRFALGPYTRDEATAAGQRFYHYFGEYEVVPIFAPGELTDQRIAEIEAEFPMPTDPEES
jgi:hypothetical protein